MKLRPRIILKLCLVAGAIVNVAVAWGIAFWTIEANIAGPSISARGIMPATRFDPPGRWGAGKTDYNFLIKEPVDFKPPSADAFGSADGHVFFLTVYR